MNGYAYPGKRAMDLIILALAAPLAVPLIAVTAFAVMIFDGPPVIFRQERAGYKGKPFDLFKFRTMREGVQIDVTGLSSSAGITKSDSIRTTKLGRLLRKSSLDELPQLLNILKGEMSVVGPRPLFTRYNGYYNDREKRRLDALPGITGLSQVRHRNHGGWRDRLEADVVYVERASFWLDIGLIINTAKKIIKAENVAIVAGQTGDSLDDERSYPHSNGLFMRRIYSRDLTTRVAWLSNPDVRLHMSLDGEIDLASTIRWHDANRENPLRRDFVIEDESGELLAMTGVKASAPGGEAEFYLFVNPDAQGRGIGTTATKLTLEYCGRHSHFKEIWLSVKKDNYRAVAIYRNCGFLITSETEDRYRMEADLRSH